MTARSFTHRAAGIDWYCETQGKGPAIVLIPSGEGDCGSFARVSDALADEFTVLTFDMPGFSRSSAPPEFSVVSPNDVADQIAALVSSLSIERATFYGCSSGGLFALTLAAEHSGIVRNAIVHEVAIPLKSIPADQAGPFAKLFSPDDATVVDTCKFLFRNVMNEDPQAWDDLGVDYHRRLEKNYLTWARRYVATPVSIFFREFTNEELSRRPIDWTVGSLSGELMLAGNRGLADIGGIRIEFLKCRHFPQVSIPDELAEHIRASAKRYL
jgi:pimeloyl-ACP methyl ester carboxylesterase